MRGLADVVERKGVTIYERTPVTSIESGIVTSGHGTVRAIHVLRCTEAFTVELEGQRRRYLPLYSLMVATEPLGPEVWAELGWEGREAVGDVRHLFFYAQRTSDDRIAIGGRGAPYQLGSPIDEANERNDGVRRRLEDTIRRHFKPAGQAAITHHWGGPLAVPRDWSMAVQHDRRNGRRLRRGLHRARRDGHQPGRPDAGRPGAGARQRARDAPVRRAPQPRAGSPSRCASRPRGRSSG